MTKNIRVAVGVLLLIMALGVVAAFFIELDSPELGRRVLTKASEATGVELAAKEFRLNLRRGLVLNGVTAAGRLFGGSYQIALDQLVFEHELLPLLGGTLAVARVRVERPQIEVITTKTARPRSTPSKQEGQERPTRGQKPAGGGEEAPSEGGRVLLVVEVSEIVVNDGVVSLRQEASDGTDGQNVTLRGLNVDIRDLVFAPRAVSPIHRLSGTGGLTVADAELDETRMRNVEARLGAAAGRFELSDLVFVTDEGTFQGRATVDFNSVPFVYELSIEGDPLNVNELAGVGDGSFGAGHLRLDAQGFGSDSKNLRGKGSLQLDAGKLPSHPVLAKAEQTLGRTGLVGSSYQATEARFQIQNNRVVLEDFVFESEQAGLDLSGWLSLEGPLAMELVVKTPREGLKIKEVPEEVLDVLTDDEGWVVVPMLVSGTRDEPQVRPDVKALMTQAGRGTKRLLEQIIKDSPSDTLKSWIRPH